MSLLINLPVYSAKVLVAVCIVNSLLKLLCSTKCHFAVFSSRVAVILSFITVSKVFSLRYFLDLLSYFCRESFSVYFGRSQSAHGCEDLLCVDHDGE